MKAKLIPQLCVLVSVSALNVAFISSALAQDTTQNSKDNTQSLDKNPSTAPTGSADKSNSKDTTTALDKNPSTAPTGSAEKSATKDPNGTTDSPAMTSSKKADPDNAFIHKAAQDGMTEVQLGQLAQEKGSSAEVKEFGSHMVMDHSKANEELKAVATEKGVEVPAALNAKHQATVDHFKTLSGPAFDHAYVQAMVKDHKKAVALFEEESTSGQDSAVKTFATKTLPTLKSHLSDIESLATKIK